MEVPDYLNNPIPYFAIAVPIGIVALVWLIKKRGHQKNSTKNCPHCFQTINTNQAVCEHCHRINSVI